MQSSNNILRRTSNAWNVSSMTMTANNYSEIGRIPVVGTFYFYEMRMSPDGEYLVTLDSNGFYDGLRMTPKYSTSNLVSYIAATTTLSNVAMIPESRAFNFSSNGNVVFMMSEVSGAISSTTLGTPFDIHTASNTSTYIGGNSWMRVNSLSPLFVNVAASISSDGTVLLVSNRLSNVLQYTLSQPGNLETASLTYTWNPPLGTNERIDDLAFTYDSSNVYLGCRVSGTSFVTVRQFTLGTPNDISTASAFANTTYSAPTVVDESSIFVDPSGSNVYVMFDSNLNYHRVFRGYMTTPNNVSTTIWSDTNAQVFTGSSTAAHGLSISTDGKTLVVNRGFLESYQLITPWDVTTANANPLSISTELLRYRLPESSRTCSFFDDGKSVLVAFAPTFSGRTQPVIHKLNLGSAWNIKSHTKTVSDNGVIFTKSMFSGDVESFTFDSLGSNLYVSGNFDSGASRGIAQFKLSTPWDLRTANYFGFSNTQSISLNSLYLSNAESQLNIYGVESTSNRIAQYSMASNGDISTLSFVRSNTIISSDTYNLFTVSSNSQYLYTASFGTVNRPIVRYSLNNSSNISNYTFNSFETGRRSVLQDVSESPWNVTGLYVTPDGRRAFVKGTTYIYEYSLSIPWDIGTASLVRQVLNKFGVSSTFYISPDGKRAHSSNANAIVYSSMSTPWDITTFAAEDASRKQLSAGGLGNLNPVRGFRMNPQGSRMIVYGATYLLSYSISNFDVSVASYSGESYYNASLGTSLIYDFDVSPSGRNIFIPYPTTTGLTIRKYISNNPNTWRANDFYLSQIATKEVSSVPLYGRGFCVDPTGSKAILLDSNTATMYSYSMGG